MIVIEDTTLIDAPIEEVFDADRNIDLHIESQSAHKEVAVSGVTSGLINEGEEVEWEAIHFGLRQRLRSRITEMRSPEYFRDEMVKGIFKDFIHEHHFKSIGATRTEKRDVLRFSAPLGILGLIAEKLFLSRYFKKLIYDKNRGLKEVVEKGGR